MPPAWPPSFCCNRHCVTIMTTHNGTVQLSA
jgi:hypothetical protein